jgi:hypothetical protein
MLKRKISKNMGNFPKASSNFRTIGPAAPGFPRTGNTTPCRARGNLKKE